MKTILAFGASNSTASINVQLARHAVSMLSGVQINFIDLNDFEMPIFSIDRENTTGIPEAAHLFKTHIRHADAILISFAEHNGSYSVAFKNILDWSSRIERNMWLDKPMCLLATSPGRRGAQSVLKAACDRFPHMNGHVISHFSLPSFAHNFDADHGITNSEMAQQLQTILQTFQTHLSNT